MDANLMSLTVSELRAKLLSREVSVRDLHQAFLAQAEQTKDLNAFREVFDDLDEEVSVAQKAIDEEGEKSHALTGIPIAIKDNILMEGRIAGAASKMLENYVAPYDATAITHLKSTHALLVGRTNMDEFAMGGSGENSAYGPTKNPHDTARVTGGTSSGSAASVAGNIVPIALGSDTGGSVRQPGAFCGVVGLKPSYGAISRYGLIAMGSSLDQIGPVAHTVSDTELLFNAVKGKDPKDATSRSFATAPSLKKTIGVPRHLFEGVDADLLMRFDEALEALRAKGYAIEEIELPHAKYGIEAYYIIMPAEASTNLARYDGIRFGLHTEEKTLLEEYLKARTEGFGPEVRRRILLGTYVLSSGYIDAYYYKADALRNVIRTEHNEALAKVDAIALPTTPTPAFKIGEKEDPVSMYLTDIFTVNANLTGLPAVSIPVGTVLREEKQLPVGFQLIGRMGEDANLLAIGKDLEK
jgi:aspartyl-tRNA(Asn)/glutamyl-tRNA(Gln) amidotransferase subunit A